jgi:hypothetical protein
MWDLIPLSSKNLSKIYALGRFQEYFASQMKDVKMIKMKID